MTGKMGSVVESQADLDAYLQRARERLLSLTKDVVEEPAQLLQVNAEVDADPLVGEPENLAIDLEQVKVASKAAAELLELLQGVLLTSKINGVHKVLKLENTNLRLLRELKEIINLTKDDKSMMREAVFMKFIGLIEEGFPLSKGQTALMRQQDVRSALDELCKGIQHQVPVKRQEELLEDLRHAISMWAGVIYLQEPKGDRSMVNTLFFLQFIDKQAVFRFRPDGRIIIPSRYDPPRVLLPREEALLGLTEMKEFLQKSQDPVLLNQVFDEEMRQRFALIGWDEGKIEAWKRILIAEIRGGKIKRADLKLLGMGWTVKFFEERFGSKDEYPISGIFQSVVQGFSMLTGLGVLSHACKGVSVPETENRGHGVWNGELVIRRYMAMAREEGLRRMAQLLLEEAQHMYRLPLGHIPLQQENGGDNFNKVVEHSKTWLRAHAEEVLDSMKQHNLRVPPLWIRPADSTVPEAGMNEAENADALVTDKSVESALAELLAELFRSKKDSARAAQRKAAQAQKRYEKSAIAAIPQLRKKGLIPVVAIAKSYDGDEFDKMERAIKDAAQKIGIADVPVYHARDYHTEKKHVVIYISAGEDDVYG